MISRSDITDTKKAAAKILYLEGYEQRIISNIIGRSEGTVSKWVKEGNWKEERIKLKLREDNIADRVMKLIEYQLNAIDKNLEISQQLREEKNDSFEFFPLISKGEIDALSKLNAMVKHKNASWMHIVNIMKDYAEHLQITDLDLAKVSLPHIEAFLQVKQDLLK